MKHHTFIFLLIITATVSAEEIIVLDEEFEEILSLDLEELTTVSIASKRTEKLEDAPGIITVVTEDEIQNYGYRNLRDILDRQPHMQVMGSNLFPHGRISMRGNTSTHVDNTVLFLLNGRPIREASSTSVNHDLYSSFPVEAIQQIEIIRGPGSVLYGTNAFAGVINIITKKAPESPSATVAVSYGSFETKKTSLSGGGTWGDLEIHGVINGYDSDGDDFNNITDENGNSGTYNTGSDAISAVVQAKYKGFTLNALYTHAEQDMANRLQFLLPSDELSTDRKYVDLGYKHDITDNWDVSVNVLHHYHKLFIPFTAGTYTEIRSRNYFAELNTRIKLTNDLSTLIGFSYNELENENFNTDSITLSTYAQVDYQLFEWLKLIGGLQYNKPEDISGDFSPRLAAIINLNEHWGIKLLYGKAFREASPTERFINAPSVVGNASLNPETVETFDAQLFYNGKRASFSATYFHSEHKDLISRTATFPVQIVNAGEIKYDGFELEGKFKLGQNFSFIGNMSYQTNEKNDGSNNATYSPDWMFKTGLSYDSPRGYQLSIFNSYFAQSTLQNHQLNNITFSNPDADGYNNLTANLKFNLGEVFNKAALSNMNFSLYGDNLLDEDIFFPSTHRRNVNSIPHHMGRSVYATISFEFE